MEYFYGFFGSDLNEKKGNHVFKISITFLFLGEEVYNNNNNNGGFDFNNYARVALDRTSIEIDRATCDV